jgi:hypothetical protein
MLQRLLEWFRILLFLGRDVQQNTRDVAELRQSLETLTDLVTRIKADVDRGQENERPEREKLALRFENALLRTERSLTEKLSKKTK